MQSQTQKPTITEIRLRKRSPIYLLLEDIRSSYNVGAIFRTADAVLVFKIFLAGQTPYPPRKEIDKSALGASDVVPWQYCPDAIALAMSLRADGIRLVALERTPTAAPYSNIPYSFPVCLIVGNEISGISEPLLACCNAVVQIPMLGRATSLNVATACGIALFEVMKQYRDSL